MNQESFIWVAYSKAPSYLPIAVADSAEELGRMLGVSENCIRSTWSHFRHGRMKSSRFYQVSVGKETML